MAFYKGAAAEGQRAQHLIKKRQQQAEDMEKRKKKLEEETDLRGKERRRRRREEEEEVLYGVLRTTNGRFSLWIAATATRSKLSGWDGVCMGRRGYEG